MVFLIILLLLIIIAGSYFCYWAWKFYNPYKLFFICGKKGSGKSTLITKLAFEHNKKNWNCYSTEHTPGCYYLPPELLGRVWIPKHSVIFIDEVGLLWHCRDYKSFPKHLREYFKLMRHYGHRVYLFSQSFDVDKSIRQNADYLYILNNYFAVLSIARRLITKLVVVDATGESESRIADNLVIQPILFAMFGTAIFTWVPHWAQYFDSFVDYKSDWVYQEFEYTEVPEIQRQDRYYLKRAFQQLLSDPERGKRGSHRSRSRRRRKR